MIYYSIPSTMSRFFLLLYYVLPYLHILTLNILCLRNIHKTINVYYCYMGKAIVRWMPSHYLFFGSSYHIISTNSTSFRNQRRIVLGWRCAASSSSTLSYPSAYTAYTYSSYSRAVLNINSCKSRFYISVLFALGLAACFFSLYWYVYKEYCNALLSYVGFFILFM